MDDIKASEEANHKHLKEQIKLLQAQLSDKDEQLRRAGLRETKALEQKKKMEEDHHKVIAAIREIEG